MSVKTIKIAVEANSTLPFEELEAFQDDLKTLSKDQYEKMRSNIIENGFSFAVHVWQNKGHNYIIDGHQRVFTVTQLAAVEGYKIPPIPVNFVKAKNFKEAKQKVLAGASQYGRVNSKGLFDFMTANDISLENMIGNFDFQEIDLGLFSEEFFNMDKPEELPTPDAPSGDMPSSSGQVKQVQLLFDAKNHEEFMTRAMFMANIYKTENITDTIMEALRETHKTRICKPK